jgi:hypothetical protein
MYRLTLLLLCWLLLAARPLHADADDQRWLARIPLVMMEAQPPHLAVGDVPDDPDPGRVFEQPIVFANHQLYFWMSSQPKVFPDHPEWGVVRNRMDWHFLPTGRFFHRGASYDGTVYGPEGQVSQTWGRYTIVDEVLQFQADTGETGQMALLHGRRMLDWGELQFGNVHWELEALGQR